MRVHHPVRPAFLGLVAGAACAAACNLKYRLGYDDSLDVVGVHFVGGWIGSLWIGLFSIADTAGLFHGGGLGLLGRQALANVIVSVLSFTVALGLAVAIEKAIGFRAPEDVPTHRHTRDSMRRFARVRTTETSLDRP